MVGGGGFGGRSVRTGCAGMVDDAERSEEGNGGRGNGSGESPTAYFNGYDLCNNRRPRTSRPLRLARTPFTPTSHLPPPSLSPLPLSHQPLLPPQPSHKTKQTTKQIHVKKNKKTKAKTTKTNERKNESSKAQEYHRRRHHQDATRSSLSRPDSPK